MQKEEVIEKKSSNKRLVGILIVLVFVIAVLFFLIYKFSALDSESPESETPGIEPSGLESSGTEPSGIEPSGIIENVQKGAEEFVRQGREESAVEELNGLGYEVISYSITNIGVLTFNNSFFRKHNITDDTKCPYGYEECFSDKVAAVVWMNSSDNEEEQVINSLNIMDASYGNLFYFRLEISSPTETCLYRFIGEEYRSVKDDNEVLKELIEDGKFCYGTVPS